MARYLVIVESPAKVKTIKMCIRDRTWKDEKGSERIQEDYGKKWN